MKKLGERSNQWDIALTVDDRSICYLVDSNTEVAVGQNYRNWGGGLLSLEPFPGSYDSSWYDCSKDIPPYIYVPKFPGYYEGCDIRQYFKKNAAKYRNHKPDPANDLKFKVTQVAQWAFYNAQNVPVVTLPETIVEIEKEAFWYCWGMDEIHLKEGLKIIGDNAFSFCLHLQEITIPDSVDTIGEGAFGGCFAMSRVVIGRGVKTLITTFSGCSRIKEVTCRALTPPSMESKVFEANVYQNAVLKVPIESFNAYKKDSNWGKFKKIEFFGSLPKVGDTFKDHLWYQVMSDSEVYVVPNKEGPYTFRSLISLDSHVTYGNKTYTVTGIGKDAFEDCETLRDIRLPNTIKVIGPWAFENTALDRIMIPNSVKEIGKEAFLRCPRLKEVNIPGSVVSIGENAFGEGTENLKKVTLHEGLEIIGDYAFFESFKLNNVDIPDGVKKIGRMAFESCGHDTFGTQILTIPDSVTSIGAAAFKGSNVYEVTLPKPLTVIEDDLFCYSSQLQKVRILENVTRIGKKAFAHTNNLRWISLLCLPPEVEEDAFDDEAFKNAKLEVPAAALAAYKAHPIWGSFSRIECIGDSGHPSGTVEPFTVDGIRYKSVAGSSNEVYVAEGKKEKNVIIPNQVSFNGNTYTVTGIGMKAFNKQSELESLKLPDTLKVIEEDAFLWCNHLKNVSIPNGVTTIGDNAFGACGELTCVEFLGNQLETIGEWCFGGDYEMNPVTIPDSVKVIARRAFCQSGMHNELEWDLIIPSSVEILGEEAFIGCNLKSLNILEGLTRIENGAFREAPLREVYIPASITSIGDEAFAWNNNSMKSFVCEATTPPEVGNNSFDSATFANAQLKVPASAISAYQAHAIWGKFKEIVGNGDDSRPVAPTDDNYFTVDGIRYVVKNAEAKEVWMTTLPDEEKYKSDLVIPPSVTYRNETYAVVGIDEEACDGRDELLSVDIPSSVVSVGYCAFYGCRNLTRLTLHNGLVRIGQSAFAQLKVMTSLTIPDTVREIGPTAFSDIGTGVNYTKVRPWDLIIPDSVVSLGPLAFNCLGKPGNFRRVILGRGLKRIEERTFDMSKMNELFIPDTVNEICSKAFISYKNNLKTITCMAPNPPRLEEKVFSDETFLSATLKVPASALDAYKADAQWGKFKKIEAVS